MKHRTDLTRREFIKGTTAGLLGLAATGLFPAIKAEAEGIYKPGTYSATAVGMGTVTVTMTFDADSITDVQVDVSQETPEIGGKQGETLAGMILNAQSSEIDGVSGASVTSAAARKAAAACIAQARNETVEISAEAPRQKNWRDAPDPIPEEEISRTYDVEIAVVGLGHAGLAVYRAAAEKGANILAVEAQPRDSWWTLGHDIGHINSEFLKSHGVPEVDPVEFYDTFMLQSNGKANPHFVMEFAKKSGEAVDWYLKAVKPETVEKGIVSFWPDNEHTVKTLSNGYRYYTGTAQWWEDNWNTGEMINHGDGLEMKNLSWDNFAYVEENFNNAQALFGTKGVQLEKDGEDRVTGLIAKDADGYIRINASKGVVLSGGGFGGNNEMCHDLIPQIASLYTPDEDFMGPMDRDG